MQYLVELFAKDLPRLPRLPRAYKSTEQLVPGSEEGLSRFQNKPTASIPTLIPKALKLSYSVLPHSNPLEAQYKLSRTENPLDFVRHRRY